MRRETLSELRSRVTRSQKLEADLATLDRRCERKVWWVKALLVVVVVAAVAVLMG